MGYTPSRGTCFEHCTDRDFLKVVQTKLLMDESLFALLLVLEKKITFIIYNQ